MSTTTVQEHVRVIVLRAVDSYGPVGLDSVSRANIASYVVAGLLSAGLLRGDDDLPAGLRERCEAVLRDAVPHPVPCRFPDTHAWRNEHDALLCALTGAGTNPYRDAPWAQAGGPAQQAMPGQPEAPATPTRRMRANHAFPEQDYHGVEHDEKSNCADKPPCQPVASAPRRALRRMWGNPVPPDADGAHADEHDETPLCALSPRCQPVAEAERDAAQARVAELEQRWVTDALALLSACERADRAEARVRALVAALRMVEGEFDHLDGEGFEDQPNAECPLCVIRAALTAPDAALVARERARDAVVEAAREEASHHCRGDGARCDCGLCTALDALAAPERGDG